MKWFISRNHQILDLNKCACFWLEEKPTLIYSIYCRTNDDVEWNLADFHIKEAAIVYIEDLFDILLQP